MFVLVEVLINVVCFEVEFDKKIDDFDMLKIGLIKLIKEEVKDMVFVVGCLFLFGFIVGVLLGVGVMIVSFMVYVIECNFVLKVLKDKFGKGLMCGLVVFELVNNVVCMGLFVLLLILGILGFGIIVIMLGVLIVYGI